MGGAYNLPTTYDRILVTCSSSTSRDHMPDENRYSFCVWLCNMNVIINNNNNIFQSNAIKNLSAFSLSSLDFLIERSLWMYTLSGELKQTSFLFKRYLWQSMALTQCFCKYFDCGRSGPIVIQKFCYCLLF